MVQARSGSGGDGSRSFRREKFVPRGGPDGGDGGRGGHVILVGDDNTDSLQPLFFEPLLFAPDGGKGAGQGMHGADGKDLVRRVPRGTQVFDNATGGRLADITEHGQEFVAARGGAGGLGNVHFKSATNQAPERFTPGKPGEELELLLELKSIADAGLVGFPSAGKSSLLAALSDARPKIAAYPFTTLNPVIGVAQLDGFTHIKIADIPGIIQNAHAGAGLGIDFLRHIARARMLVFVVDIAGVDGREPWVDFKTLRAELKAHDPALLELPSVVVANKMDVPEAKANLSTFKRKFRGVKPIPVSTTTGAGLDALRGALLGMVQPVAGAEPCHGADAVEDQDADADDDGVITPERLARAFFLDLPKPCKTESNRARHSRARGH